MNSITVDFNLGLQTDVFTAPSCPTVVFLDRENQAGTCFDIAPPGPVQGTVVEGVDCTGVNFDGVTDVYGNFGGGFVAFNSDTGAVQCFGFPQNGGECPPGLTPKPGLVLYEAHYAF